MIAYKTLDVFAVHASALDGDKYIVIPPTLQGRIFLKHPSAYVGEVWGDSMVKFWIRKYHHTGDGKGEGIILTGMVVGGSAYPIAAHFSVPIQFLDGKGVYRHLLTWHSGG